MPVAYKLFRVNKRQRGKLFPLFVDTKTEIPIGEWITAKEGEQLENGKVKSKLGPLCFRPGFHLSDIPLAVHIGVKGKSGKIEYINRDYVWCLCEYCDTIKYQDIANENGTVNGKLVPKYAYLKTIPENGYYRYKTSPNMLGEWIIAGEIKVIQVLSDEEVETILKEKGYEPMPREGGKMELSDFGFA